jgi:glutathione peroxidase
LSGGNAVVIGRDECPLEKCAAQGTFMTSFYDFSAPLLDGANQNMADFEGKVVLVVNVASHCGFTPQYAGLETLWRTFRDKGLMVLGFPCNQFGGQEPGSAAEIGQFCSLTYDVTFPIFSKIDVNGRDADPLYAFLRSEMPGILGTTEIKWNFTKFLVDRHGEVVNRFAPDVKPENLVQDIEELL